MNKILKVIDSKISILIEVENIYLNYASFIDKKYQVKTHAIIELA